MQRLIHAKSAVAFSWSHDINGKPEEQHSFYFQKLVCKVDQLVKRRAKSGLIRVNVDWNEAKKFVQDHLGKEIKVCVHWIFNQNCAFFSKKENEILKFGGKNSKLYFLF